MIQHQIRLILYLLLVVNLIVYSSINLKFVQYTASQKNVILATWISACSAIAMLIYGVTSLVSIKLINTFLVSSVFIISSVLLVIIDSVIAVFVKE